MNSLQVKAVDYQQEKQAIEQIRTEVFQLEQGVSSELEFDGKDASASHFLAYLGDRPVGTTRIRNLDNDTAKIERLAVLKDYRQQGIARQLMLSALKEIWQQDKTVAVVHGSGHTSPNFTSS